MGQIATRLETELEVVGCRGGPVFESGLLRQTVKDVVDLDRLEAVRVVLQPFLLRQASRGYRRPRQSAYCQPEVPMMTLTSEQLPSLTAGETRLFSWESKRERSSERDGHGRARRQRRHESGGVLPHRLGAWARQPASQTTPAQPTSSHGSLPEAAKPPNA